MNIKSKTQNIFCCVNENWTTFLYILNRGDKKTEGEKKFLFKVCNKVEMLLTKKNVFFLFFLVLVFGLITK